MDEGRFWPPVLVLALLVVSAFAYRYLEMVDKANAALETAKLIYTQGQESLRLRKERCEILEKASLKMTSDLERQQEVAAKTQAENDLQTTLQKEADTKERSVKRNLVEVVKSIKSVVGRIRSEAVGTVIPELHLAEGKVLKSGKILKVNDSSISFSHSEGITSVSADLLPPELVEHLDLGPGSISRQLEQLETSLIDSAASDREHDAIELAGLKKSIASMQAAFDAAEMRANLAEGKVIALERQITQAANNQLPTFNMRTMRDLAEGSAGQARNELRSLKAELDRMKAREKSLTP